MKCTICNKYEVVKYDIVVHEYHKENLCKHCLVVFNYTSYKLTYSEFKAECMANIDTYLANKEKRLRQAEKRRSELIAITNRLSKVEPVIKCGGCGNVIDLAVGCCDISEQTREKLEPVDNF